MKNQLINQLIISSLLLYTNYLATIFHPTIIRYFFQASNRYRFIVSRTAIHAIVIKQNPLVSVLLYSFFQSLVSSKPNDALYTRAIPLEPQRKLVTEVSLARSRILHPLTHGGSKTPVVSATFIVSDDTFSTNQANFRGKDEFPGYSVTRAIFPSER